MATRASMGEAPAFPFPAALGVVLSQPRPVLARLAARLIERLDEIDGEPDMEDDDPAGGSIDDEGEGLELLPMLPRYGADQTRGPNNEAEAVRDYYRRLREAEE